MAPTSLKPGRLALLVGWLLASLASVAQAQSTGIGEGDPSASTEAVPDTLEQADETPDPDEPPLAVVADNTPWQPPEIPLADAVERASGDAVMLRLLGKEVPPGSYRRLAWAGTELFEGIPLTSPVLVVNGARPGPTLCLTAAVHGDELNGIEMVRRVLHELRPEKLSGAVIGVPIVNIQGFKSGTRYLPDRRDLNRYFPGNSRGSAASRIAGSFFNEVVSHCNALVDLHTGSFERANLPQLRADMRIPDVVTLTEGFGATVIINSIPREGTLRHEATKAGIPTVTLEAGGPGRLELDEVDHGVKGIETLLNTLGMVNKVSLWGAPEQVYYKSTWVRADRGGILLNDVELGASVDEGELLGTITDPITNAQTRIYAPKKGRVIGLARNQVVMPGFAAYHLGIDGPEPLPFGATAKPAEIVSDETAAPTATVVDATGNDPD